MPARWVSTRHRCLAPNAFHSLGSRLKDHCGNQHANNKAIHGHDIYRAMKLFLKDFEMPLLYSPHSFRVTTIADLLEQNVPREDVQHLAGHAGPRRTNLIRPAQAQGQPEYRGEDFRVSGYDRSSEIARQIAAHESSHTTGLYDRCDDDVRLDEVERIIIWFTRNLPYLICDRQCQIVEHDDLRRSYAYSASGQH